MAVLGNESPRASVPGEIVPGHEFYDYDDKYLTDGADLLIPGQLARPSRRGAAPGRRRLPGAAGRRHGPGRLLLRGGRPRRWLVNELNTIPGFTPISMYPSSVGGVGLAYAELVDELVRLGIERSSGARAFSPSTLKHSTNG